MQALKITDAIKAKAVKKATFIGLLKGQQIGLSTQSDVFVTWYPNGSLSLVSYNGKTLEYQGKKVSEVQITKSFQNPNAEATKAEIEAKRKVRSEWKTFNLWYNSNREVKKIVEQYFK